MNSCKLFYLVFPAFFSGLFVQPSLAFENSSFALQFPDTLTAPCLDVHIEHRFYTSVSDQPLKNAFGLNGGIVADLGARWVMWNRLQSAFSYDVSDRNVCLGLSYAHTFLNNLLQASAGSAAYNYGIETRTTATFSQLGVSAGPFFSRVTPVVNAGYDSHDRYAGLGLGADAALFDFLDIAGEFFPIINRTAFNNHLVPAFAFGVILKTYRHHFSFFLSNTSAAGMRNSMKGAENNSLHFGFRINRLFDFNR
jgi:hypothetical protein